MNCPNCGFHIAVPEPSSTPTRHNLSEGHVRALWKLRQAVKHYNRNEVNIRREMADVSGMPFSLTKDEWTNFTKLRFHALAFKVDGRPGYWGLAAKGGQFLRGEADCMKYVYTEDNKVIGHDGPALWIWEVKGGEWWEKPVVEPARQQQLV